MPEIVPSAPEFKGCRGGGRTQAGSKRSLSPSLRSTERNDGVDAPVPATTSATVAAVENIRNILAGAVTIITAGPTVSSRKIPPTVRSEEAVQARVMGGRLP